MLTLDQGILMALVVNGIGIPLLFFAYYKAFKNYEDRSRHDNETSTKKSYIDTLLGKIK